ncbi:MMPL family transporter [Nocardia transvalensis]|uniref:MMPL family transporter n=1 Tax=Nocardia transvalensis TaxID=37333 RepID=UPI002B4B5644|nr:MMPL family transporter [Nocardia transvalensis]
MAAILLGGVWGLGVLDRLNLAGYEDPASQSAHADELVNNAFGRQTPDIVAIYTAPAGKTLDDIRQQVMERLDAIDRAVLAKPVESYWSSTGIRQLAMISADRRKAIAALSLSGTMSDHLKRYPALKEALTVSGVDTEFAGFIPVIDAYNERSKDSVVLAESVAIPLMLALLVVVFGGFVAASVPVIVGGLAVWGALGALRAVGMFTDVSAFALNIASILGLGLAIDYSLFMVSRFREELGSGRAPIEAARRAVQTAGRTITFSALLLVCAFAGTLVFPPSMLRSLGFGAMAAVVIAAFVSVTALPAALALLGDRINALPVWRGAARRSESLAENRWAKLATWVIRRPIAVTAVIIAVLLALSVPFLGIKTGGITPNVLPADDPVRVAQAELGRDFPNAVEGATVLIRGDNRAPPSAEAVSQVMAAVQRTDGVRMVVRLAADKDLVLLRALLTSPDFSPGSVVTVKALHDISAPPGTTVLIGGINAFRSDGEDSIARTIPLALTIMLVATLVVMVLAFRSIVLPLKAVAMAAISLTATFGILTWIFVDGHGAALLGAEPGPIPTPALVVVVAAVFGLATDYEVFLMSRMIEAHDRGADTEEAVREGVSKTGRIITTAAVLFMIVTGAAALSNVTLIKVAALGMTLAILIDATIVRMLLVPAIVKLMGRANWWMPIPRLRGHAKPDVSEEVT